MLPPVFMQAVNSSSANFWLDAPPAALSWRYAASRMSLISSRPRVDSETS